MRSSFPVWVCLCGGLLGLALAACASTAEPSQVVASVTVVPSPTAVPTLPPTPTAAAPGQAVVYANLQLALDQAEFSQTYITEYGSSRLPPPGAKFLWLRLTLASTNDQAAAVPALEHFSVLYTQVEYKPTYGHRQAYADYAALGASVYPGQALSAWLRFDVPQKAELAEMQFAFMPESSQLQFLFSPEQYAWAVHPVYLWRLGP